MKTFLAFLLTLMLAGACKVYEKVPSVRFQGPEIQSIQSESDLSELTLKVNLRFLFSNPFNKDITIPRHDFNLKINGKKFIADIKPVQSFVLKGNSVVTKRYPFEINLNQQNIKNLDVLGKDNYLEFAADVKIDLADYGIKVPTIFGKQALRYHTLSFSYGDTLRFPLLPEIRLSNQPAHMVFIGHMEQLDLEKYKDAFAPFVTSMMEARYPDTPADDFVATLINTKVNVLGIEYTLSEQIGLLLETLTAAPGIPGIDKNDWETHLEKLNPEGQLVMDHFLNTFAKPIVGNQVLSNWNNFKYNWDNFLDEDLVITYPGANIHGLEVRVPFVIYNPNYFAVESPSFFNHLRDGNWEPLLFNATPTDANTTIAARSKKEMTLTLRIDWSKGNQGILDFVTGKTNHYDLEGETKLDLGYGPVTVKYQLPALKLQTGVNE
ncbi:hypothetical protein SAMN06265379_104177 [Saccharicrinis carchari]|uniref:Uncharacterized protein n=1 Tax=Saccharicrinis carchari TaxID=1168039 RepID=A0A521D3L3_SACCC|nr:hypothetical protein [Saccharicrinis carchari]SMO66283.1 hypothetical protein SAMN06265379_104177 [Saccharicrinis carchari]